MISRGPLTQGRDSLGKELGYDQAGQNQGGHRPALNLEHSHKSTSVNPCTVAAPVHRPVTQALASENECVQSWKQASTFKMFTKISASLVCLEQILKKDNDDVTNPGHLMSMKCEEMRFHLRKTVTVTCSLAEGSLSASLSLFPATEITFASGRFLSW